MCQQLIPRANGRGRALAAEVMVANSAVRALIRENKAHQIYSIIQTGGKYGMRTMNQSLFELYEKSVITFDDAISHTLDEEDLKRTFQRAQGAAGGGHAPGGGAAPAGGSVSTALNARRAAGASGTRHVQ
jgi:twitching motility protein PilT